MKIKLNENGSACRGYRRNGSGMLEIVDLPVIDGQVVNGYGHPYELDGDVVELIGWPDDRAVEVQDNLLIAIENEEKPMNVKQLETEVNYDKEGNDRVWFQVSGFDDDNLNGVYGVINGEVVCENGADIDSELSDSDAIFVRRALNI